MLNNVSFQFVRQGKLLFIIVFQILLFGSIKSQVITDFSKYGGFLGRPFYAQTVGSGNLGVVSSDFNALNNYTENPALLVRNDSLVAARLGVISKNFSELGLENTKYVTSFIKSNSKHALGITAAYLHQEPLIFVNVIGEIVNEIRPIEVNLQFNYAYRISKSLSIGAALKYFRSDIFRDLDAFQGIEAKVGHAVLGDLGLDYQGTLYKNDKSSLKLNLGLALRNVGNKMRYLENIEPNYFAPTDISLGAMLNYELLVNSKSRFCFDLGYSAQKRLVPFYLNQKELQNANFLKGALLSFGDNPDGLSGEFDEVFNSFGSEARIVLLNKFLFALRGGRFISQAFKESNGDLFLAGIGLGFKGFILDFALPLEENWTDKYSMNLGLCINIGAENRFSFKN